MSLDFLEFDAFLEIASELVEADLHNTNTILNLFREWQVVEAMEMAKVTNGRITTIEKLQILIDQDALEVPTLHNFLKEFPWVIDPRWTMVDDEVTFSKLLRERVSLNRRIHQKLKEGLIFFVYEKERIL